MTIESAGKRRKGVVLDRNHLVGSVNRAFAVLDVFGARCRPLSHSDIVRETGQPKASIHRIVSTLVNLGLVARDPDGRYRLTFKLWGLGMAAFADIDLVKVAQGTIESLKLATEETADLAVLDGPACTTYLWKSESPHSIRVQFWVGMRTRSWRSATGRAILAFLPDYVEELLDSDEAVSNDIGREQLLTLLRKVRRCGFAVTKGDNHPEMGGIAAPIRDHTGVVIASCGIAVPRYRMTNQLIRRCTPEVLKASEKISAELGYRKSA